MRLRHLAPVLAALAGACGQQLSAPALAHLDRPTDISFGCAADVVQPDNSVDTVALPATACAGITAVVPDGGTATGTPDAGASTGAAVFHPVGFVIEASRGDVSVGDLASGIGTDCCKFVDNDALSPGLNGIPVGRLPVGVATSANGCYAVVANGGSCDLALVHVAHAYRARPGSVHRQVISSSAGRIAARPTAIVAPPSDTYAGTPPSCDVPSGVVYVSFASCHLVARVDLATGNILDGVQFRDGQPPAIVGPDVSCPVECTDLPSADEAAADGGVVAQAPPEPDAAPAVAADAGTGGGPPGTQVLAQPVALDVDPQGDRLYIGAADSPNLVVVDLGAGGAPSAVHTLALEGAGGITKLAATGDTPMGNLDAAGNGVAGVFRFVYAIGQDQAIHVANVSPSRTLQECDTQLDRRFLHDFTSVTRMSCFPVGASDNPPRRADARGPGIRLPAGVLPLDLKFIRLGQASSPPNQALLNGTFAVVSAIGPLADYTSGRGLVYLVNVNDANYPDTQPDFAFTSGDIAFALPHSLRDVNLDRMIPDPACQEQLFSAGGVSGPIRLTTTPDRLSTYTYNDTGTFDSPFAPSLHRVLCPTNDQIPLWELSVAAPLDWRGPLFPDLGVDATRSADPSFQSDEQIVISWEGPLTALSSDSRRSGGQFEVGDGRMTLHAQGALLCGLGAENGDYVTLHGCASDSDCGLDETCVIHPDAPPGTPGMCLPKDNVTQLTADCREIMISSRRYTAVEIGDDHVVVVPRSDILYATPINGCTDDAQCNAIEDYLVAQAQAAATPGMTIARHSYTCDLDPARGGPKRCITTCAADADCQAGAVCDMDAGRCILGAIPPPQCLAPLQSYEILAGDAYSIVSTNGEYRGRKKVGANGLCVDDPSLSPLIVNRFHKIEPVCTDVATPSVTAVAPNPCSLPNLVEPVTDSSGLTVRPAYGIRVRSPGITFDVTDVAIPFPAVAGLPGVLYSPVNDTYFMSLRIAGGFLPFSIPVGEALPSRVRLAPDGSVWVVDSGDHPNGVYTGQIIQMVGAAVAGPRLL